MSIRIGTQSVADSPYSIGVNPGNDSIFVRFKKKKKKKNKKERKKYFKELKLI